MTYTSDVQPGQPASMWALSGMTLWKLSVSEMHNNVYLLRCNSTGKALLIDAAADPTAITQMLETAGVGADDLVAIVTTHKHWDHHRALPQIAKRAQSTMSGEKDAPELPVSPTRILHDEDVIQVGELRFTAHHIPGHTPGSIVVSWTPGDGSLPHLFTGDTLFPGGVGATDRYDDQDFDTLFASVSERIFGRFDDAHVHPGHGADTRLGTERPHLDEWRARGW